MRPHVRCSPVNESDRLCDVMFLRFMPYSNERCMVLRLFVAVLQSSGMGFEHMRKMRAAGLRTRIPVSVGSAMVADWHIARQGYVDQV